MLIRQGARSAGVSWDSMAFKPFIQAGVPGPVQFKIFEEQQEFFEMFRGQAIVNGPEGMGQAVGNGFSLADNPPNRRYFPGPSESPDVVLH